jgi:hypothetical protein
LVLGVKLAWKELRIELLTPLKIGFSLGLTLCPFWFSIASESELASDGAIGRVAAHRFRSGQLCRADRQDSIYSTQADMTNLANPIRTPRLKNLGGR